MANKKIHAAYVSLPSRHWVQRASFGLVLCGSMALMVMSKAGSPVAENTRTRITDVMMPVLSAAASPVQAVHEAGAWVADLFLVQEENVRLRSENSELLKWQAEAKAMRAENDALRSLLKVVPQAKPAYVTARIISDMHGPYVHSALINAGNTNGVLKDRGVISDNGLVGRVVDVGRSSARVLLLSDINSRVPVVVERTHEKSILAGNNSDFPVLTYLSRTSQVKPGDRVVTSGDGGVFAAGIPVGVVVQSDDHTVKVQPYIDAEKIAFVSVVDASF